MAKSSKVMWSHRNCHIAEITQMLCDHTRIAHLSYLRDKAMHDLNYSIRPRCVCEIVTDRLERMPTVNGC